MKVYLASGFFNEKQKALVTAIENLAEEAGVDLYSPRRDGAGILTEMTQAERDEAAKTIFAENCFAIATCDMMIAVIDDRDVGVVWEMGYAYGMHVKIVSFTNENFGMNVMMKGSIVSHLKGLEELKKFFDKTKFGVFEVNLDHHPVVT